MINRKISLFLLCTMGAGQVFTSYQDLDDLDIFGEKNIVDLDTPSKENTSKEPLLYLPPSSKKITPKKKGPASLTYENKGAWAGLDKFSKSDLFMYIPNQDPVLVDMQNNEVTGEIRDKVNYYIKDISNRADALIAEIKTDESLFTSNLKDVFSKKDTYSLEFKNNVKSEMNRIVQDRKTSESLKPTINSAAEAVKTALKAWHEATGVILASDEKTIKKSVIIINENLQKIAAAYAKIKNISKEVDEVVASFDDLSKIDIAEVKLQKAKASEKAEAEEALLKAKLEQKKEEYAQLHNNLQEMVAKIASLRNVAAKEAEDINAVIAKIIANESDYSSDFISAIHEKVTPNFNNKVIGLNKLIEVANDASSKTAELNKKMTDLDSELTLGTELLKGGQGSDLYKTVETIDKELGVQFRLTSKALSQAISSSEELSKLHVMLIVAEERARLLNPKLVERVLELTFAIKEDLNKKTVNVLELVRAVKQSK